MSHLVQDISSIKQAYRERFVEAQQELEALFQQRQASYHCTNCNNPPTHIDAALHAGCGYIAWQKNLLDTLQLHVGLQINDALDHIRTQKERIGTCHMCGACCRMASSEHDYDELLARAKQGEWYAEQFTRVFRPYESVDDAKRAFPELVEEMLSQTDGDVHFYYCPHLTEDNRCGIYNDPMRPQLCADYPENPLTLMHQRCGYQPWRIHELPTMLHTHAKLELARFYANKLIEALRPHAT